METNLTIRMATTADAKEILEIYAPYVTDTAVSFEYDVPSDEEFAGRIEKILRKYPYLVAVENDRIIGYAYVSSFKEKAAYDWSVETTIYLRPNSQGKGVGKKLYLALEKALKKQNILNLNACIAYIDVEDKHLTNGSTYFHERLGYREVAHFTKCGYKFGKWYDMIWMEKMIGEHTAAPTPFIPLSELQD